MPSCDVSIIGFESKVVVSFCLIGSPELHCIVLGLTPPLGLKDRREKALNAKNVAKDRDGRRGNAGASCRTFLKYAFPRVWIFSIIKFLELKLPNETRTLKPETYSRTHSKSTMNIPARRKITSTIPFRDLRTMSDHAFMHHFFLDFTFQ
jgi:hypothetical protein